MGIERHIVHAAQQRGFPLTQAITFQLVQAITAVFGYSACSFLIDRSGRRPVLFLYYFIGAFCHLWFALASGMWLYFAAAAIGWVNPGVYGATGIYVSELHPTHLRATAVGWFFGIGRIGSFLAPTVVGLMLAYGAGAYVLYLCSRLSDRILRAACGRHRNEGARSRGNHASKIRLTARSATSTVNSKIKSPRPANAKRGLLVRLAEDRRWAGLAYTLYIIYTHWRS